MSVRIKVNEKDLSKIQEDLKKKGYTLDDISEQIDSDFRYCGSKTAFTSVKQL